MDLVDRIETSRFLGGEFLLWLWFSSEVTGGVIEVPGLGGIEVALGSTLMLADPLADQERVTVRGQDPCAAPEADQALRQGKLPRKVGLRFVFEQAEWAFSLDTATLSLSGVKLPVLLSEGEEEHFHERMRLLEQLHELVQATYGKFLRARLLPRWDGELVPALRRWVSGELEMDPAEYEELHDAGSKPKKRKRKT